MVAMADRIIIVENIPSNWTDRDVKRICSKYGDLKDFIRFDDCKTFALVSFEDECMAQDAANNLPVDTNVGIQAYVCDRNTLPDWKSHSRFTLSRQKFCFELGNSICIICNGKSKFVCERCGDPYCSIECQQKDWRNHKQICFPLTYFVNYKQD